MLPQAVNQVLSKNHACTYLSVAHSAHAFTVSTAFQWPCLAITPMPDFNNTPASSNPHSRIKYLFPHTVTRVLGSFSVSPHPFPSSVSLSCNSARPHLPTPSDPHRSIGSPASASSTNNTTAPGTSEAAAPAHSTEKLHLPPAMLNGTGNAKTGYVEGYTKLYGERYTQERQAFLARSVCLTCGPLV